MAILPGLQMNGAAETAANMIVILALFFFLWRLLHHGMAGNDPKTTHSYRGLIRVLLVVFGSGALLYLALMEDFDLDSRRQPIFQQATATLRRSDTVNNYLGNSVHVGWPVHENSNETSLSGTTTLAVPVSGDRAKGTLYVIGIKTEGKWAITAMFVILEGETTRHNLAIGAP